MTLRASCSCTSAVLLRAGAVVCATCGGPVVGDGGGERRYSQRDGERPAGCGRAKYLRIWRRARDAGDLGATSDGRARLLSPEAYERHRATTSAPSAKPKARAKSLPRRDGDVGDDVLEDLGIAKRTG